ncbi:dihydroxyacetone kinase [Pelomyxa schiedti]|nr:dihydroxyacetone kinase [Pelomyxa schiedti]
MAAAARKKTVAVFIATGTEDVEMATAVAVLRRAGVEVTVASVSAPPMSPVRLSRGLVVVPDVDVAACVGVDYDMLVLPGGMPGCNNLRDSECLKQILLAHNAKMGLIAAICAAPVVVLKTHGLLEGHKATCHPNFAAELSGIGMDDATIASRVVVHGNLITSRGPGTSMEFALKLVEILLGPEARKSLIQPLVLCPHMSVDE